MGRNYDMIFPEYIKDAWDHNGLFNPVIVGERREGKTSYALKGIQGFFHRFMDMTEDEAWEEALDRTFFQIENVIDEIYEWSQKTGERTPVILWDDAGVHGSKYHYMSHQKQAQLLKGMMDTVGTVTACLALTTPVDSGILKFLNEYNNHKIQINKRNGQTARRAVIYKWKSTPMNQRYTKRLGHDDYTYHIPNKWHEKYAPKREELAAEAMAELREEIKEAHKGQPDVAEEKIEELEEKLAVS